MKDQVTATRNQIGWPMKLNIRNGINNKPEMDNPCLFAIRFGLKIVTLFETTKRKAHFRKLCKLIKLLSKLEFFCDSTNIFGT